MNIPESITERELLERIQSTPSALRAGIMTSLLDAIVDGRINIIGLQSEALDTSVVVDNLLRALDAVMRYELVDWAANRATQAFTDDAPTASDQALENLLAASTVLLVNQPIFDAVLSNSWNIVGPDSKADAAVQLAASRLLYDANELGDSPEPWKHLVSRHIYSTPPVAITALAALLKNWPSESIDFLMSTCASVGKNNDTAVFRLANLISLSADEITNGVGVDAFSSAFRHYSPRFAASIREALEYVASERGWVLHEEPNVIDLKSELKAAKDGNEIRTGNKRFWNILLSRDDRGSKTSHGELRRHEYEDQHWQNLDEIGRANRDSNYQSKSYRSPQTHGCFPEGTSIRTPQGVTDIARIEPGDLVLAYDESLRSLAPRKVLAKLTHKNNSLWSLSLASNHSLKTTRIHSFISDGKWKRASQLRTGDNILYMNCDAQSFEKVVESKPLPVADTVYNLIVEINYTYVAAGVVAHSFSYFKAIRKLIWAIRARFWLAKPGQTELTYDQYTLSPTKLVSRQP